MSYSKIRKISSIYQEFWDGSKEKFLVSRLPVCRRCSCGRRGIGQRPWWTRSDPPGAAESRSPGSCRSRILALGRRRFPSVFLSCLFLCVCRPSCPACRRNPGGTRSGTATRNLRPSAFSRSAHSSRRNSRIRGRPSSAADRRPAVPRTGSCLRRPTPAAAASSRSPAASDPTTRSLSPRRSATTRGCRRLRCRQCRPRWSVRPRGPSPFPGRSFRCFRLRTRRSCGSPVGSRRNRRTPSSWTEPAPRHRRCGDSRRSSSSAGPPRSPAAGIPSWTTSAPASTLAAFRTCCHLTPLSFPGTRRVLCWQQKYGMRRYKIITDSCHVCSRKRGSYRFCWNSLLMHYFSTSLFLPGKKGPLDIKSNFPPLTWLFHYPFADFSLTLNAQSSPTPFAFVDRPRPEAERAPWRNVNPEDAGRREDSVTRLNYWLQYK